MTDTPEERAETRRRWINIGEIVAVAGLIISALALWNSWKSDGNNTTIVEKGPTAIPLTLRGAAEDEGKTLVLSPVEPSHALQSIALKVAGKPPVAVDSDGRLPAADLAPMLSGTNQKTKRGTLSVTADVRYVELGKDRRGGGRYVISYRWTDGGLFGGKTLRLTGIKRG